MPVEGASIHMRAVSKAYGDVAALADVSLDVAQREIVAVVGPSGCGKSTLLELACGLQQPTSGTVDAEPATLMPQRDALLPLLSAQDNAGLALRLQGRDTGEVRPYFKEFGLDGF